jgi:hypothetical protein
MHKLMRKRTYTVGALGLSVALAASGVAYGQNGVQTIDGNVTPPAGSKNAALSVEVAYVPGSDGIVAHATNAFIEFPSEGKVSTKAKVKKKRKSGASASAKRVKRIPKCDPATIEGTSTPDAIAACGKAQVGEGSAIADVGGIDLAATVTAFNGEEVNGNPSVLLHSRVDQASLTTVLVGEIRKPAGGGGPYGYSLNVPVPPLAGGAAAIERFQTTVQRKITKDVGYISGKCGDDGVYSYRGTFDFSDAPQAVATDEQTC